MDDYQWAALDYAEGRCIGHDEDIYGEWEDETDMTEGRWSD